MLTFSWKCGKAGHLADDCTAFCHVKTPDVTVLGDWKFDHDVSTGKQYTDKRGKPTIYKPALRNIYNKFVVLVTVLIVLGARLLRKTKKNTRAVLAGLVRVLPIVWIAAVRFVMTDTWLPISERIVPTPPFIPLNLGGRFVHFLRIRVLTHFLD